MRLLSSIVVFFAFAYVACALPYGSPVGGQPPSPGPANAEPQPDRKEMPFSLGVNNCQALRPAVIARREQEHATIEYKAPGSQKDHPTTFKGDKDAIITEISLTGGGSREQLFSDVNNGRIERLVAFGSEAKLDGAVVYFIVTSHKALGELCIEHWKEAKL